MGPRSEEAVVVLLTGILICLSLIVHWGLRRTSVPSLVGYLLIGFLLRVSDMASGFLTDGMVARLDFLADIGVITLLFKVGLESSLEGLLRQLRKAQIVWLGDVLVSGVIGYLTSFYVLGLPLVASLYIAAALTATSVGVSVAVWRETDTLRSANGQLLLDVAEMDDISAIILMSLLLALTPVLLAGQSGALFLTVLRTGGSLIVKLLLFGGFCYVFSRFAERPVTRFYERIKPMPDPMLMLAATGFIIAALAELLGFSIAVGAFFAGLVFSRDPETVTLTRPFAVLYDLFTPFFFISIGLHIEPHAITSATFVGMVLFLAAVFGKVLGAGGAALPIIGRGGALLMGVSMIPRAEIAMILMRQGRDLGDSVVPAGAFAAMVFVSATTCILSPLLLRPLLTSRSKLLTEQDTGNGPEVSEQ